eukprot:2600268-Alexandrium_andersonii.AAC.1
MSLRRELGAHVAKLPNERCLTNKFYIRALVAHQLADEEPETRNNAISLQLNPKTSEGDDDA